MNVISHFLITCSLLLTAPVVLACDYPSKPEIPVGSKASKDEMLAGQRSVREYMAKMEEYLACIDREELEQIANLGELSDEEKANREDAVTKKYNAAVQEMELLAARFNEQVQSYRAQGN